MFLIWLLLGHAALAAPPQTLKVETVARKFSLTLDDKLLTLRSPARNAFIKRSACNEALVTDYWKTAGSEVKKFPKIKGGTLKPSAVLNGQRHLLRGHRRPAAITDLDRRFHSLKIREHLKCKGK